MRKEALARPKPGSEFTHFSTPLSKKKRPKDRISLEWRLSLSCPRAQCLSNERKKRVTPQDATKGRAV